MIYNLKEYLKTNYPSYSYTVNGYHDSTPVNAICLNNTTSIPANWIDRSDFTVQVFSRAESPLEAEKQIQDVFNIMDRYFNVVLPETTETLTDGSTTIFPEVEAYQIIPIQRPYWFGYDQNSRALYVFNVRVTTK
jgi:hypothetical protein